MSGSPSVSGVADRLDGAAALVGGDVARAVALLRAARQRFDDLKMAWEAARTGRLLALALERAGRPDQAASESTTAGQTLAALGAVNDRVIDTALSAL